MKLSPFNRVISVAPAALAAALLSGFGCADISPATEAPPVDGCSELWPLLAAGKVRAGASYTGENGFSLESAAGVTLALADIATCERLERSAESLMASGVPGVSIAYRTPRFQVALPRGLADVEAGVPLRADALLRGASLAKTYVGTLAALLASEDRLDLDNTQGQHALSDYLPFTLGQIEYADRITLRQLLNHTSGIPDYYGERVGPAWLGHMLDSYHRGTTVTEEEALGLVYGVSADFEPGTSGRYSNTPYLLMGRVLDGVLGHSYVEEIHKRFLDPLGLGDTYFEKHDPFDMQRLAHGYRDASELGEDISDWYAVDQGYGFANGGVVARLDQLATFFRAIPGGEQLPADIDRERFLETLRPTEPDGYGLGIQRNGPCYYHNGTFNGYVSVAFHCTDRGVSGALFINSSLPEHDAALSELANALME